MKFWQIVLNISINIRDKTMFDTCAFLFRITIESLPLNDFFGLINHSRMFSSLCSEMFEFWMS